MMNQRWQGQVETPCYIIDLKKLKSNLRCLKALQEETGCRVLLAQKAFANFPLYQMIAQYLCGTAASGLYEARLGREEMGKEVHVYSPAFQEQEFPEILRYADHIVFNSPNQMRLYAKQAKQAGKSVGIRINPQCSTQSDHPIYDPCAPGSRLGATRETWDKQMTPELLSLLDGLHFHTLCEQDAPDLDITLQAVERQFSDVLQRVSWINFGGGHHITKTGYQIETLKQCIARMQKNYDLTVYLEPGEAIALNAGYAAATVLDIIDNESSIAILDISAACHMPDVLEMPYRPPLQDAGAAGAHSYRLAGPTCLAGDVIGDYSFAQPLRTGQRLVFEDMAIYTMVKNNTFNGMALPAIYLLEEDGRCHLLKKFGYQDFKGRLG